MKACCPVRAAWRKGQRGYASCDRIGRMTIEYVPVSGEGRLWTEKSGDGMPVVLLHGSVQDSRLWDGVFPELGRHRTAIRYDARGLGRSTLPTAPFRYEDDLLAVLDHFGI